MAVYSTADKDSLHVRFADEAVCIGPPMSKDSYLKISNIIAAAEITNADAIPPGYGFLSENAKFSKLCEDYKIKFIGASPDMIAKMGDKATAKATMIAAGVPVIPGSEGLLESVKDGLKIANEMGYPVILKATAGGGGRGMRIVERVDTLLESVQAAQRDAEMWFGDDTVYMERFLQKPRHVEVQVLGDGNGHAIHLYDRDCSLQRRHQKVLEEAPSPVLATAERDRMGNICAKAMADMGYRGAGTIEFLWENGEFYFIEMNTRLQVEHPVTEMITGIDLVREQIRVAEGKPLSFTQEDVTFTGHAVECRINAEDPQTFMPSPGTVSWYHPPGGLYVRVDSGLYHGYKVPPYYDSMIAKLIVYGQTREGCLMRLRRALGEFVIEGMKTTIPLHQRLLEEPDFQNGNYTIKWLEEWLAKDAK